MRLSLLTAGLLASGSTLFASQADPLSQPDAFRDYVPQWADFWTDYAYDESAANGSYYVWINRDGSRDTNVWKYSRRASLAQTRNAYAHVRAFMLNGDESHLTEARQAIVHMHDLFWNDERGGWYRFLTNQGNLTTEDNRGSFHQQYNLLGSAMFLEASPDSEMEALHRKGLDFNETFLWDHAGETLEGWYEDLDWDAAQGTWVGREKGFTGHVDGISTHIFHDAVVLGDALMRERLADTARQIDTYLVGSMDDPRTAFGFVSNFTNDWDIIVPEKESKAGVSVGHMLKAAWQLLRTKSVYPEKQHLVDSAQKIIDEVYYHDYDPASGAEGANSAWDHTNGGPHNGMNWLTGERTTDHKDWWTVEQGYVAGMMAYHFTGEDLYQEMARESLSFFEEHFIDHTYGEVYTKVSIDGDTVLDDTKGYDWKAGYHSTELGYYATLYGNLYLHGEPTTLYYRFTEDGQDQEHTLTPIAILEHAGLHIASVERDGQAYNDYDGAERTVRVPAGQGGVFAVTFDVAHTTDDLHVKDGAPAVALSSPASTVQNAFVVTATFDEVVAGFDIHEDVTVTNGSVSAQSGSGTTYQFVVTPHALGEVVIAVDAGAAVDAVQTPSLAAQDLSVEMVPGADAALVSGTALVSDDQWVDVELGRSFDSPVVAASIAYELGATPAVVRARQVDADTIQLRAQNPSGAQIDFATINYFVAEAGSYQESTHGMTFEAFRYDSSRTDGKRDGWKADSINTINAYNNPVVVGSVMSDRDADWSSFWTRGSSRTSAPNDQIRIGKHVGEDRDTDRAEEILGYVVFEAGSGTIDGQPVVAGVGSDSVRGGKAYRYDVADLPETLDAVVLASAGMDGGDGAWPVLLRTDTNGFELVMDEDQLDDSERWHTSESVAYVALGVEEVPTIVAAINIDPHANNGNTWDFFVLRMQNFADQPITHIELEVLGGGDFDHIKEVGYTVSPNLGGGNDGKKASVVTLTFDGAGMEPGLFQEIGSVGGYQNDIDGGLNGLVATVYFADGTLATGELVQFPLDDDDGDPANWMVVFSEDDVVEATIGALVDQPLR